MIDKSVTNLSVIISHLSSVSKGKCLNIFLIIKFETLTKPRDFFVNGLAFALHRFIRDDENHLMNLRKE
jgi:hypothetical protein